MADAATPATLCAIVLSGIALGAALAGCGEEEQVQAPPAPPPVAAPPPAPPKPAVTSVADLMAQLAIDERVMLPEDQAPPTTAERVAVLEFFDAFARGDNEALGTMLSSLDRRELDGLVKEKAWQGTIAGIEAIELETGAGPYGQNCALALFDVSGMIQPQLWYYTVEGDQVQFEAAPTPPGIMDKLYGNDWIALWHKLLEEEIALANEVDRDLDIAPIDISGRTTGAGASSAGPSGSPNSPGKAPGGPSGRRKPPGQKRRPPGAR